MKLVDFLGPALPVEQVTGIEPAYSAWEADTLPLSYTCIFCNGNIIIQNGADVKSGREIFLPFIGFLFREARLLGRNPSFFGVC